jgi:hypothetical protein
MGVTVKHRATDLTLARYINPCVGIAGVRHRALCGLKRATLVTWHWGAEHVPVPVH